MEPYGQLAETVFTECLRSCGKRHRLDGCLGGAGRRGGARRIGAQLEGKIRAVEFRSEAARVDLNAAPKPLLAGLFAGLGADHQEGRTPPYENARAHRLDATYHSPESSHDSFAATGSGGA